MPGLALILPGVLAAFLFLETGLYLIPEFYWKKTISRNPWRHILFETDPDIGWVHKPNARMNWTGSGEYSVDVQINSLGLRDYDRAYDRPAGIFRILVLGDSFTEAIQVPLEQTFPARLEQCLAGRTGYKVEVINAGVSGYGPGEELLFFQHRGQKFRPDLVLSAIFVGNDIYNMGPGWSSDLLAVTGGYQFWLQGGQLQQRWVEWADLDEGLSGGERFLRRYSRLYYILKSPDSKVPHWWEDVRESWKLEPAGSQAGPEVKSEASDRPAYADDPHLIIFARGFPDNPLVSPAMRQVWDLFKASHRELQHQAAAGGATLAAIIIPRGAQVHESLYRDWVAGYTGTYPDLRPEDWDVAAPDEAIRAFLQEQQIPALDLLPGFRAAAQASPEPLYFPRDGHFNEQGHQLTAELTCDWLMAGHLLPQAVAIARLPHKR